MCFNFVKKKQARIALIVTLAKLDKNLYSQKKIFLLKKTKNLILCKKKLYYFREMSSQERERKVKKCV